MSTDCLHGLKDRKRKEKRRETKWKRKTNHLSFCVFGCRNKDQINLVGHKEVDLYVCATTLSFFSLFASPLHKKLFTLFQRTTS